MIKKYYVILYMKIIKATHDYDSRIDEDFDSRSNLSFKTEDLIFLKNKIDKYWGEGFIISNDGKLWFKFYR